MPCLFAVDWSERLQWEGPTGSVPYKGQQRPHRLSLQQTANPRESNWRAGWSPGESFQEVKFDFCLTKLKIYDIFHHNSH